MPQLTGPIQTVLGPGTVSDYQTRTTETGVTTIKAGLLVYKSTAAGADNDVNLCGANHGDAISTEESIEIVEVVPFHAELSTTPYDLDTAYAAGVSIKTHKLHVGDKVWVKTSGTIVATDEDDALECAANGLVEVAAATAAVDTYNAHVFVPVRPFAANVTWILAEYKGVRAIDAS